MEDVEKRIKNCYRMNNIYRVLWYETVPKRKAKGFHYELNVLKNRRLAI